MKMHLNFDEHGNPIELLDDQGRPVKFITHDDNAPPDTVGPELTAELSKKIGEILERFPKTKPVLKNSEAYAKFIGELGKLVCEYRLLKAKFDAVTSESELVALTNDWIKDLKQSQRTLSAIDGNFQVRYLIEQMALWELPEFMSISERLDSVHLKRRTLASELSALSRMLESITPILQKHVKKGRPQTHELYYWFIRQVARLYREVLKLEPAVTFEGSFENLIRYLFTLTDEPKENMTADIQKALKS